MKVIIEERKKAISIHFVKYQCMQQKIDLVFAHSCPEENSFLHKGEVHIRYGIPRSKHNNEFGDMQIRPDRNCKDRFGKLNKDLGISLIHWMTMSPNIHLPDFPIERRTLEEVTTRQTNALHHLFKMKTTVAF